MPITANIDGIACTLEKMPDGRIRVTHESHSVNSMHGPGTGGEMMYFVHPAQIQQYEHFNNLLPPNERDTPKQTPDNRPWWSYAGGAKDKERAEQ